MKNESGAQLKDRDCIPCRGGVPALKYEHKIRLLAELGAGWRISSDSKRLSLEVKFADFNTPMSIANDVAKIAHEQWHHPSITISFGEISFEIWTHKIDDLVESDFIFAAKISEVIEKYEA